jgi:hypothetical protein
MSFKGSSLLAISSCDGYCSFIEFPPGELGEEYPNDDLDTELKGWLIKEDY